ncbi:MAG: aspartate kinase [Candidatus Omnitrophota bacterium]|nr:MAG: aspartate kinase [Candidatus Omnitrophota bacterium]
MSILVMKFGGTSVGSTQKILAAAEKAIREKEAGHQVVVTVSAMSGETDRLLNLANEIDPAGSPREKDMLASTGEQVSIALFSIAVQKLGYPAISFIAPQIDMKTDRAHQKARLKSIDGAKIQTALNEDKIVVIAGFQGVTDEGEITTLGRGGSDTTAVAIAAVLGAQCDIYTDVDGVYAADPRIVPKAKRIPVLSYEEMLEMASSGAKVLHTRSVQFAAKYNVPLQVRSSFDDKPGTMIIQEVKTMEQVVVSAITHSMKEAKVTLSGIADKPGTAATIFKFLAEKNINVDMIVQNVAEGDLADISFTVERTDVPYIKKVEMELRSLVDAKKLTYDDKIAKISAIGVGMRTHAGVAARMFDVLAAKGINILMISTSEIKISCVIEEAYTELAVRALCEEFGLEKGEGE